MNMKKNILPIAYIALCLAVAVFIVLIEPIDGVILVNSLPFKVNNWNFVQTLVSVQVVLGALLVIKNWMDEVSGKKYDLEKNAEQQNESVDQMVEASEKDIDKNINEFLDKIETIVNSPKTAAEKAETSLWELCKQTDSCQAVLFTRKDKVLEYLCGYAFVKDEDAVLEVVEGDGLSGQVFKTNHKVLVKDMPQGYAKVVSGLGESYPTNLLILPFSANNKVLALVELAFFKELTERDVKTIETMFEKTCQKLNFSNL